jgi:hypothetical protein
MGYETNRIITQEELNKMGEELSNYAESLISQQFKNISNNMDAYEKKYKEANDKVAARFGTNVAKEIFADLYESEDENIRNWLLNLVQSLPDKGLIFSSYDDIEKAKVLAWLEKQDPKKHEEELEKAYKTADEVQYKRGYEDGVKDTEKQGERKPTIEMKSAEESLGVDSDTYNKIVDECIYGEQASDWSKEDERHLNTSVAYLKDAKEFKKMAENCIDWLNSLKDRYTWKPSDEQMEALAWALSLAKNCGEECAFNLRTLQDQLKKLRGE